jgi:hypothetical protein
LCYSCIALPNFDVHRRDPQWPVNVETSQNDWVLNSTHLGGRRYNPKPLWAFWQVPSMKAREARQKAQLFGFHAATAISETMNAAYDDLPGVSVSRLRALGDITEAMKVATVKLGEYEFTVGLSLFRWPNGGSWSFFVARAAGAPGSFGCLRAASHAAGALRPGVFTRASNW